MNGSALLFMAVSWIGVIGLTVFCFYRVFTTDRDGNRKNQSGKS